LLAPVAAAIGEGAQVMAALHTYLSPPHAVSTPVPADAAPLSQSGVAVTAHITALRSHSSGSRVQTTKFASKALSASIRLIPDEAELLLAISLRGAE
jgi:hypothetical protein